MTTFHNKQKTVKIHIGSTLNRVVKYYYCFPLEQLLQTYEYVCKLQHKQPDPHMKLSDKCNSLYDLLVMENILTYSNLRLPFSSLSEDMAFRARLPME
jgi:hypothetical protein